MLAITTVGLDIAKSVFQVHGIDAEGKVVWPLNVTLNISTFRFDSGGK